MNTTTTNENTSGLRPYPFALPESVYTSTGYQERTSPRFKAITTADALDSLSSQGWELFKADTVRTRQPERIPYAKHVIQLTHPDLQGMAGHRPLIYLQNANDGTSSFRLFAGLFRFICANGLVVGSSFLSASVRHSGERSTVTSKLQEKTWEVASEFPRIMDRIDRMRTYQVTNEEKAAFSFLAFNLRFPKNQYVQTIGFHYRREGDQEQDLWTFYNRAQEDIIRGGFHTGNRMRTARGIRSLEKSTLLNRKLWDLTEKTLDGTIVDEAQELKNQKKVELLQTCRVSELPAYLN
jgi:hypothetical protein